MRLNYWITSAVTTFLIASPVLSQTKSTVPPPTSSFGGIIPMMLIMFAIIYFLMIRPEQKKQKTRQTMMGGLKKGDKVVTIGGMMGVVHSVKDAVVVVRVADNTNIEFTKAAIANILTDNAEKNSTSEKTKDESKEVKEKK